MTDQDAPTAAAVDRYLTDMLVNEDEALRLARESSAETTAPGIEITPAQGAFLALIAQIAGARRVLEFGTLAGYSTIWLARAVGPEGHVVTCELSEQNAAVARRNLERAGVSERVDILVGPALDSARSLAQEGTEPFDLVFVDADKPNNPGYLEQAVQLGRPGTVLIVDNVVRGGAIVDASSEDPNVIGVRALMDALHDDPRIDATALQTVGLKGWDGFSLARIR
ncbi:O-methyltransferase [Sediminivirga luteola]|uniref:O-methyltransferase n=1 Tax=Sediminivirga luteola TaxID=1774748 RepID=A0A8J2U118_9MICO|nr:O-methyltransferase [Sediminivirga luteola]